MKLIKAIELTVREVPHMGFDTRISEPIVRVLRRILYHLLKK